MPRARRLTPPTKHARLALIPTTGTPHARCASGCRPPVGREYHPHRRRGLYPAALRSLDPPVAAEAALPPLAAPPLSGADLRAFRGPRGRDLALRRSHGPAAGAPPGRRPGRHFGGQLLRLRLFFGHHLHHSGLRRPGAPGPGAFPDGHRSAHRLHADHLVGLAHLPRDAARLVLRMDGSDVSAAQGQLAPLCRYARGRQVATEEAS